MSVWVIKVNVSCVSNCMSFVKFKFDQRKCLCKTMKSTNVNSVKDSELL